MTLLLIYVLLAVGFSFLCSILEASFLSVRIISLLERKEAGDRSAERLLYLKQERVDDALSAILILNTIANTAGAVLAGAQASKLWDQPFVFSVVFIGLILVLGEIIPKTMGAAKAARMVPFTARIINGLIWITLPILLLTRFVTRFMTHLLARRGEQKPSITRGELTALATAAAGEGTLSKADLRVVSNVLSYHEIKVEDVMTPRMVMVMLPMSASIGDFLEDKSSSEVSRIPLFEDDRDSVTGYVLQREVLSAAARGQPHSTPLARFLRKATYLPESQTVGGALRHLIELREHMALVTDEYGGISGLVSLEDLVETTLGIEILDESDRVADLRAEAIKLRDRRLEEFREWRKKVVEAGPKS